MYRKEIKEKFNVEAIGSNALKSAQENKNVMQTNKSNTQQNSCRDDFNRTQKMQMSKLNILQNNIGVAWYATQNAITLISLVITIILLLILAGVILNLALGNNGIFKLANNASKNYMNEQEKELSDLEKLYSQIKVAINDSSQITISIEDLNKIIDDRIKKSNVTSNPVGTVISYMGNNVPIGYLTCDGSIYNISDYTNLAEQIKTEFGSYNYFGGDGETTFAVPNLQGEFLRGYSKNETLSVTCGVTTANIGQHQNATIMPYFSFGSNLDCRNSPATPSNYDVTYDIGNSMKATSADLNWTKDTNVPASYSIRPTNTSVLYCIKYT